MSVQFVDTQLIAKRRLSQCERRRLALPFAVYCAAICGVWRGGRVEVKGNRASHTNTADGLVVAER